jgi:hypothetical protein
MISIADIWKKTISFFTVKTVETDSGGADLDLPFCFFRSLLSLGILKFWNWEISKFS